MATLVLSAAGAAIGGSVGGTVLGLTTAALGKAVGATIGSAIDQKLMGAGSTTVQSGRVSALRIQGASEGATVPRVFGRMRVGGNVIWASRFVESKSTSGGGKGNPQKVVSYSYSVSLAIALCEGVVTRIGRAWADGAEISLQDLNWRLVSGTEDQMPDPLIEAIEGVDLAPAYRGTAYIVIEDLDLGPFGNRVPQFNFEVVRKVAETAVGAPIDPYEAINAVALVPGSGEYSLATSPIRYDLGKGTSQSANHNTVSGVSDIEASINQLDQELPNTQSVSLVVSWFGDDLRCGSCTIKPKVEQNGSDPIGMPWRAGGLARLGAELVSTIDGRPAFGGTPTDQSVVEAINLIKTSGKEVMFYPFILMDVPEGNNLPNPWLGGVGQAAYPWRGRITLDLAPGLAGSVDQTPSAKSQIDAFFGNAVASDFAVSGGEVLYSGPLEWSYRRCVLHYAHLCALAGGVDTFIIGSELRGLTTLRDGPGSFPAVDQLIALTAEVRAVLGPDAKISYAADWSEYFGYQPADGTGDVFFHLDPLWADPNIDFVGIDNYMPLSDWRDDAEHLDVGFRSIYNLEYLKGNVAGGEGFDWFYLNQADRNAQIRVPITDGAYGEDWVYRYKDLKSWWAQSHHNRPGGVRDSSSTEWIPQSKPIWFTEFGCPAIDKGPNQPNVFFDPKSAESEIPYYSTRHRDDYIQYRYFQAQYEFWGDAANNPISAVYGSPMVDLSKAHVWAWDARPWPDFPNRIDIWSDGENYATGHWISGRTGLAPLAAIVGEISERANFKDYNVDDLHGVVEGYLISDIESPRQSLQPLMLSHGFDGLEIGGSCAFRNRAGTGNFSIAYDEFVAAGEQSPISLTRSPQAETTSSVQIKYYHADNDFQVGTAVAGYETASEPTVTSAELPLAMSAIQGVRTADRWLIETQVARDVARFAVPLSRLDVTVGDVVDLSDGNIDAYYRIDKIEETSTRYCDATRVEPGVYLAGRPDESVLSPKVFSLPAPVYTEFLDLPLMSDNDTAHAPLIAALGVPWVGQVAVYSSSSDSSYALNTQIQEPAVVGTLVSDLPRRTPGIWAEGIPVTVRVFGGELQSRSTEDVLNGANFAAVRNVGDQSWEVLQFRDAELVDVDTYALSGFLRGQFGTEFDMPAVLTAGADFVLLDGSAAQINLSSSERGLDRHYRVGPASRGYDDDSYVHFVENFAGIGLRPYAPVHLRAHITEASDVQFTWVRQTRIDGESWAGADVPLGEDSENYIVRIVQNGDVIREAETTAPSFLYTSEMQLSDSISDPYDFEVAQVSVQFGPGPFRRITVNG